MKRFFFTFSLIWGLSLFLSGTVQGESTNQSAVESPLKSALSLWHFQDLTDSAGGESQLQKIGEVELNVPLSDEERAASLSRGGDGKAARFTGKGCLRVGDGTSNGEWNISGSELSFYLRVKLGKIPVSFPIFSKHGGHQNMAYNLFAFEDFIGAEIGTTGNRPNRNAKETMPISCRANFSEMLVPETAASRWHDIVCRVNEAKMELFVDGRCVDEDFVLGELKQNSVPLYFGAQDTGNGTASGTFYGEIDTAALWNRSLSDEEILQLSGGPSEIDSRERTDRGNGENLQYWAPPNAYGVGDCFPFSHDGVFHFVYLLDKAHHSAKNGYGAHQWIQATSKDLVNWEHQPFLVPITRQNEGSICTGSVFFFKGIFYALYANRSLDAGGKLACAVSTDGIHFTKQKEPFIYLSEGYSGSLRDPVAIYSEEEDLVHLYATTTYRGRGCWAHLVSKDMENWELRDPVYFHMKGEPECPDWFKWGKYYYTIEGVADGIVRFSENLDGPWTLVPGPYRLMQGMLRVPKTAPWKDGRRIVCGFTSQRGYGGDAVFHELIQFENGVLGEKFVPEMIPETEAPTISEEKLKFRSKTWENLPSHYRLQARISFNPAKVNNLLDFRLKLTDEREIRLVPNENLILVGDVRLEEIDFSKGSIELDVILIRDILDVCVENCRTATIQVQKAETRTLTILDESEFLTAPVKLSCEKKLPQADLPVQTGYVLESLTVSPLKNVYPRNK